MDLLIEGLRKSLGTTPVLHPLSLEIRDRELFFLLGPSGCGKTTLLRLLAGFYPPDAGVIRFGGRDVTRVPSHQRNTGMVFQNYALWPHMTVECNVAYGLEVRGVREPDRGNRVRAALETVRMESFASRMPNQLSGGQQQRVALARALVVEPGALLLDEPLSNLDAQLRLEMREEIRRIQRATQITTVYVTHDQQEALSLADRLAVMRAGRIEQIGTPREIYQNPATEFVAGFIGECNWMEGRILEAGRGEARIRCGQLEWTGRCGTPLLPGTRIRAGFRPESIRFVAASSNQAAASVLSCGYLGEREECYLAMAELAPADGESTSWKASGRGEGFPSTPGESVLIHVAERDIMIFPSVEPQPSSAMSGAVKDLH